jgi:peptidoglycan/LPS O-acetylase OafA/YrhL
VLWLRAFILGPLLTTLPLHDYFRSTLPYRAAFGLSDHLPGVFTNNPFSSGINGSLWTLRYEGLCYFIVLILGLIGLLKRWPVTILFLLLLAARLHFGSAAIWEFGALFAAGATMHFWQPPLRAAFAIPAALLCLASLRFGLYPLFADTAGAYLVLYLALAITLPNLAKYGDLSYGVYIYAWPIQQSISLLLHANWILNLLLTLPVVLVCAFLSWHVVESPALRLKNKKLFGIL